MRSTNRARSQPDPAGADRVSGIDKRPVAQLAVFEPGPSYGDGPGVVDDVVGDSKHHGGAQKAVYAFAREELDWWAAELGVDLPDGSFGENLTTQGIDLERLLINQQVRIGSALLEVSVPRQPCRTFAAWTGQPQWIKTFANHGRCGVYFRVTEPGIIRAGDRLELVGSPEHDIDMITAFRSAMGDMTAARRVYDARCLPPMYHQRLVRRFGGRGSRVAG